MAVQGQNNVGGPVADYKELEAQAVKKYLVEKVFIRKERFTIAAKTKEEAVEKVQEGWGRHAGQTPEVLVGAEVTEIGIDKKVEGEEDDEKMVVVPKIIT
jgi:hypothetical protein